MDKQVAAPVVQPRMTFPWPISIEPDVPLPDPRDEPTLQPSERPNFGDGPCGEAAARHWQEHLDHPLTQMIGASPAHEEHLKRRADRCRQLGFPDFDEPCAQTARRTYAYYFILSEDQAEARRNAEIAQDWCRRLVPIITEWLDEWPLLPFRP